MKRGWLSASSIAVVVTFGIVGLLWAAILQRTPSPADCAELWNRPTNEQAQGDVIGYSKVSISGWVGKAGSQCTATFFDDRGAPWQTYASWLADPDGLPSAFGPDIGGDSFGAGWYFHVPKPDRPNATVERDGRLSIID